MQRVANDREVRRPAIDVQDDWNPEQLQKHCRTVLQSTFPDFQNVDVRVAFYPYVGLTHTLRRTPKGWVLRISDHCRRAPSQVIDSIVLILGCKVMRRKPSRRTLEIYESFRLDPEVEAAVRKRREEKGRKLFSNSEGIYHSLKALYEKLNEQYFNRQIEINRIGWGRKQGRGRLGHYDPIHNTITLSPSLDSPRVPSFVVQYIVYHEMLHALFGKTDGPGFRKHHPREFTQIEKAYPDYARANKFLETFRK